MELSSSELIRSLTAGFRTATEPWVAREVPPRARRQGRQRRCECGECRACAENARWERIFVEKFADPNYYSALALRSGSPLGSL